MPNKLHAMLAVWMSVVAAAALRDGQCDEVSSSPALAEQQQADRRLSGHSSEVRNIILMLGDGMGPQQLGLLSLYVRHAAGPETVDGAPAIERVMQQGVVGIMRTEPYGAIVADSASSASQLATGEWSSSETIGANYRGDQVPTIVEIAREQGKATGLVTDTRMTHATPAAFAAHQRHRSMENEIAVDLLENGVDVLLGGGLRHWVPKAVNNRQSPAHAALLQMTGNAFPVQSKRDDNRNLLLEARRDYALAFDRAGLQRVDSGRLLGLFAASEMIDAMTEKEAVEAGDLQEPTLVEMTSKALELLDQDEDGFFLMVEGGQIDWAGHNNDAGTLLHELLRFDKAVQVAFDYASQRDDTLLLVTADHETGSFGFSFSGRPLPEPQRMEGTLFQGALHTPSFNFASPDVLDRLYRQRKSFYSIFNEFDALPKGEQTAERLVELVNANMSFSITVEDGQRILKRGRNPNYSEGHQFVGSKTVPRIRDFNAYYVFGENLRYNLLGRALATQQNVVWGTGTHTSTPVPLGAYGPPAAIRRFTGIYHATDVGKRMIELVRPTQSAQASSAGPSSPR